MAPTTSSSANPVSLMPRLNAVQGVPGWRSRRETGGNTVVRLEQQGLNWIINLRYISLESNPRRDDRRPSAKINPLMTLQVQAEQQNQAAPRYCRRKFVDPRRAW